MAYGYGAPRDPTAVVGRRITAYVIDWLLTAIALLAVLALVKHQHRTDAPADACAILRAQGARIANTTIDTTCIRIGSHAWLWKRGDFLTAVGVAALVGVLNLVVMQALTGASIGKHALGLRVVNEQGQPAGFGRVIVRWLLLAIDGGFVLVGLIAVLATHFHRRIGDFAAGTYVVAKSSAGRPVGVAPVAAVPYGGSVFAAPVLPGYPPPAPAPPTPGWGAAPAWQPPVSPAPPPTAPPTTGSSWSAPPAPDALSTPAVAPVAPEPYSAPAPPVTFAPSAAPTPTPSPPPAPTPSPPPAPTPTRLPEPESWWDTAIPSEPADGDEPA